MAVNNYEGLVALYAELGITSTRRPPSRWQPEFGSSPVAPADFSPRRRSG
ncbi:MAG TPA: hypothetical protein VGK96_14155 [Candidatus Sulfotelmatobacter sp.]|jgi:hypothetical protein